MDRKEAIEWLKTMKDTIELYNALNNSYTFDKYPQAIGMAIESLSDYDEMEKALGYWQEECSKIEKADSKNITESPNDVVETDDEVIEHDREWIIGCIKHDGFIKTDRFDKANQIILDALSLPIDITAEQWDMYVDEIRKIRESFITPQTDTDLISRADAVKAMRELLGELGERAEIALNCLTGYVPSVSADAEWIPFRDDLLIRENAAEVVGEFFNKMDISLFGRTGVRLARNVLNSVPTVAPLKWIPLNKDGHEPLFEGDYLLCLDDGYIASVYFDGSDWELWADSGEPVAWMPLPKPYREDGEV